MPFNFKTAAVALTLVTGATFAVAEDFPSGPINVIVPFPAGSNLDVLTRIANEHMSRELGVPLVTINVPGGGNVPGVMRFLGEEADGHTLLRWVAPTLVTNPLLREVPYDAQEDIIPIFHDATNSNVLYVAGDSDIESFDDFLEAARSEDLLIGVNAIGAPPHMSAAQLNMLFDINLQALANGSIPNSMAALIGDQVPVAVGQLKQQAAFGDEIRAIAILDRRLPHFEQFLPGVPTVEEVTGEPSDSWINGGYGIEAGTPQEIIDVITAAAEVALNSEAYRTEVAPYTIPTWVCCVEETTALVQEGIDLYGPIIEELGLGE